MIWWIITAVVLIILNIITLFVFNSYQEKTSSYAPDLFWIIMLLFGIVIAFSVFHYDKIDQTDLFVLTGFHIGFILSVRLIIGKETERDVVSDMTEDEKIEWRESSFDYKDANRDKK
ncbi:MAG: hypothetical protein ACOC89_00595 [Candidatus Saliniplasma sp.]